MEITKTQKTELIKLGKAFEEKGASLREFVLELWDADNGVKIADICQVLKDAELDRATQTCRNWVSAERKVLGLTTGNSADGQPNPAKVDAINDLETVTLDMDTDTDTETINEICLDFIRPFVGVAIDAKWDAKKPRSSIVAIIKTATQAALRAAGETMDTAKAIDKVAADAAKDDAATAAKDRAPALV